MRKVILYIATSADGYIAKPDGNIDWLHNPDYAIKDDDMGYSALLSRIDTTLMGNKTYQQILNFGIPFPYVDQTNYIFSKSEFETEHGMVINTDIPNFVSELKKQEGKDIWLIGGGQINSILMKAGLVDEIINTVMPIYLGEGIPFFAPIELNTNLNLIDAKRYPNGILQTIHEPK